MLIVGPNTAFLSYISAVLPTLGEVDGQQTTVDDLIGRAPVRATDPPARQAVKHDARMAQMLARALCLVGCHRAGSARYARSV